MPTPVLTFFPFPSSSPHVPTFYLPCPPEIGAYMLQQVLFITTSLFLWGKKNLQNSSYLYLHPRNVITLAVQIWADSSAVRDTHTHSACFLLLQYSDRCLVDLVQSCLINHLKSHED